jgi:hypothetical protein
MRITSFIVTLGLGLASAALPASAEEAAPAVTAQDAQKAPATISVRSDDLTKLLADAGWVSDGKGRFPVYMVGFRTCPGCNAQKKEAGAAMQEAGAELRIIVYARKDKDGKQRSKPEERALVAELWKNRSYDLYKAWYAVEPDEYYEAGILPPAADGDAERTALVDKARTMTEQLKDILAANGIEMFVPLLLWQENGTWKVFIGYETETFGATIIDRFKTL